VRQVDAREALAVLGLSSGASMTDARDAYRRLVRTHHPDIVGNQDTGRAARLTEAYAVLRATARSSGRNTIDPGPDGPTSPPVTPAPTRSAYEEAVEAERAGGDTLLVHAPANETYAALFEAAGRIGHIAYFDRQLGIIEAIVRFEGGPSCSLLITLQGRVNGTEAFLTLESIEAGATPPLAPVVDALVDELTSAV
jgi:hypothetical protein